MLASEWSAEAQKLDRETFVTRHPGWFLVLADKVDAMSLGFRTRVGMEASAVVAPHTASEVLPVRKAAGNPYPDRISLGRARNCDVVVRHESVSKLHAHFRVRFDDSLELVDLQSQNGSRINDRPLPADAPERLEPGDVLIFGTLAALFVDADGLFDALQRL